MTWEKEFDEQWADLTFKSGSREHYEQLKSFIQQEIDKAQQEAIDQLYEKTQLDIKLAREQGRQEERVAPLTAMAHQVQRNNDLSIEVAKKLIRDDERKKVVEIIDELKCSPAMSDQIHCTCLQHLRDKLSY